MSMKPPILSLKEPSWAVVAGSAVFARNTVVTLAFATGRPRSSTTKPCNPFRVFR